MNAIIKIVVPAVLVLGAIWLTNQEYRSFRCSSSRSTVRFIRRLLGALAMVTIAYMLHNGDTTLISAGNERAIAIAKQDKAYVNACLNYWLTVMGLVFGTIGLALWDVVDSLVHIKNMLHASAQEDIKNFANILAKTQQSESKDSK